MATWHSGHPQSGAQTVEKYVALGYQPALHLQNRTFPANSKSLGLPALVIVPKAALPNEPLGSFKGGVLLTLKTSARNSRLTRSDTRNVLLIIRSASWSPGPRTGFRELLPMLNCPEALKADLSNHSAALRVAK